MPVETATSSAGGRGFAGSGGTSTAGGETAGCDTDKPAQPLVGTRFALAAA